MPRLARRVGAALGALAITLSLAACGTDEDEARVAEVVNVMTRADEPLLRTRPDLAASKYAVMSASTFAFFRGSFPLFVHDATEDATTMASGFDARVFPLSLGDAHPENVGTLLAADGTLGIEANDFDAGDRWPWLWEVRRLATGMAIAARVSNPDDDDARRSAARVRRDVAAAVAAGYAEAIARFARGEAPTRIVDDAGCAHFADLLERAAKDARDRSELAELTVVDGSERTLLRGGIDDEDPEQQLLDVDALVRDALPGALERWRASLPRHVAAGYARPKDVARQLGSGVASRPRARFLVLVEGPTMELDDDVLLEVKEIGESGSRGFVEPGIDTDGTPAERAVRVARTAWGGTDADPLWGATTLLGLPVQIRAEREAHKTLRVARLSEDLGTPAALVDLGHHLGALLARIHARSDERFAGTSDAIAHAVGEDVEAFVREQADAAVRGADRADADRRGFARTLDERGPLLGFPIDPTDALDPEEAALFGAGAP